MNKNFMKSSVKALAVAVAALAFTSCSKDTFTEKDALNLELSRLRAQRTIDSIKTAQDRTDRNALLRYQRALDSLDRENAGGRVFYTVNVISATSAGVANGRTEESEGVTGASVTTAQYGRTVSATTQAGIATFELRSGEATVAVSAPAHTSADYTVNLTGPFSGAQTQFVGSGNTIVQAPRNGSTVYVGNVVPLFQISTDATQMATLRGRATIETDLTNASAELANAANAAIGVPVNVSAAINTQDATFFTRFLAKTGAFETEGAQNGGTSTKAGLGRITKIFYSPVAQGTGSQTPGSPIGRSAVGTDGTYSMLLPASASGLPIRMLFDEIGANRTFFSTGTTVTRRFLYGPNVTPTTLPDGRDGGAYLTFQAFTTAATVTASYTPEVTSTSYQSGVVYMNPNGAGEKGIYFLAPTATITGGGGTGATVDGNAATMSTALGNSGGKLTEVASVKIGAGGTGYTANASVSFTRTDIKVIGAGNKGSGVSGGIANYIRVDNGGTGFVEVPAATTTVNSGYTNFPPTITFTNAGVPFTPALPSPATASAVIDKTVGTVAYVQTAGGGTFPIPVPTVTPRYGTSQSVPGKDAMNRDLFAANGTSGLQFNPAYVPFGAITGATVAPTVITFEDGVAAGPEVSVGDAGIPYTFVPTATLAFSGSLVVGTSVIQTRAISLRVVVGTNTFYTPGRGKIVRIEIADGGAYSGTGIPNAGAAAGQLLGAGNTALAVTDAISISIAENAGPNTGSFAFTATAFPTGTGIDNYTITDNTPTTGAGASIVSGATTIPDAIAPTGPLFTPLAGLTANQIDNMVAGSDFLVAFDKPTGEPKVQAWGIPVIDGTGRVVSVRILTGGAGYAQASVGMTLIPNPFRGTPAAAPYTAAPTDRTRAAAVFSSGAIALGSGKGLREDYLTDAKGYELGRPTTFSFVDFTVTNAGGGYAQRPSVVLFDGGLTFQAVSGALNADARDTDDTPAPLGTAITNADLATGSTTNDGRGDVVKMSNGGIASVGYPFTGSATGVGRLYFQNDPKFVTGATLSVLVQDALSADLETKFNNNTAGGGFFGTAAPGGTGVNLTTGGAISSITIGSGVLTSVAPAPVWPELNFNRPPLVSIISLNGVGTGATAVIDPAPTGLRVVGSGRWKIQAIRVTAGGSGWGRTNRFFNPLTGSTTTATTTSAGGVGSAGFVVFGGNENAMNQTGLGAGNVNSQFDAFNGVTYVRDIYYGTGRISQ
jgi:hypothetical protein